MRAMLAWVAVATGVLGGTVVLGHQPEAPPALPTYVTAEEAFAVGAAHRNARNYQAAEVPLEAALKLSDDITFRVKTYQALIPSYRLHAEVDDLAAAVEYVIENGVQLSDRSGAANALLALARERRMTDDVVKRYEQRLGANPDDRAALLVLSEVYGGPKRDAKQRVEMLDRFISLELKRGEPQTVVQKADLAQLYVKAEKFREGAELYEAAAGGDANLAAWHWKEAAGAWLKAGEKQRALAAAQVSSASLPEVRSKLLTHFWHKGVADAFLDAGAPALAIPHYEQAIAAATVEGYRKASEEKLAQARRTSEAP